MYFVIKRLDVLAGDAPNMKINTGFLVVRMLLMWAYDNELLVELDFFTICYSNSIIYALLSNTICITSSYLHGLFYSLHFQKKVLLYRNDTSY